MRRTAMRILKDRQRLAASRADELAAGGRKFGWDEARTREYSFWLHEQALLKGVVRTLRSHPLGSTR